MPSTQVSNWFANARRRLKNTVRQPDLSWALRIKLYNNYIQGNAERLSVCSDDTDTDGTSWRSGLASNFLTCRTFALVSPLRSNALCVLRPADEECHLQTPTGQSQFSRSSHAGALEKRGHDGTSPPSKYKSSLLNRYLNDTLRHMMAAEAQGSAPVCKRRSHFESFSSVEGDQDAASPASSYETEAHFIHQKGERCRWVFFAFFFTTSNVEISTLVNYKIYVEDVAT